MCLVKMFGVLRIYTSKMDVFIIRKEKRNTLPVFLPGQGLLAVKGMTLNSLKGNLCLTDPLPGQCSAFHSTFSPDLGHQPRSVFLSFHRMTVENQTFTI